VLNKGFIRNSYHLSKLETYTFLAYWAVLSLTLYLLFIYITEGLAFSIKNFYFSVARKDDSLKIFSVFYASLSVSLAFGFTSLLFLRFYSSNVKGIKRAFNSKIIQSQIGFNNWGTLAFVGRLLSVIAIFFAALDMEYSQVNTGYTTTLILYITPLVLYLNSWLGFYRLLGRYYFKYMIRAAIASLIMISCLFIIKPLRHAELDAKIRAYSLIENYGFQLPKMESSYYLNQTYEDQFIVAKSPDSSLVYYKNQYGLIALPNQYSLIDEIDSMGWAINLYVDKDVSYGEFNLLQNQIWDSSKKSRINVHVNTTDYHSKNPFESARGQQYYRLSGCKKESEFIDELVSKNISPSRVRWPKDDYCYRIVELKRYNRIIIEADTNSLTLNGQSLNDNQLMQTIFQYFSKYKATATVLFKPSQELTLDRYFEIMDLMRLPIIELRRQNSSTTYDYKNINFRHGRSYPIDSVYPLNIIELKGIDLKLYDYLFRTSLED